MARADLIETQLAELRTSYPTAEVTDAGDGTHVVGVQLTLPSGWNRSETHVSFVIPQPYPAAALDCFYAEADLRLADGGQPANTGVQALVGRPQLWFSWHLQQPWQPARHTLRTYVRFIEERFRRAS